MLAPLTLSNGFGPGKLICPLLILEVLDANAENPLTLGIALFEFVEDVFSARRLITDEDGRDGRAVERIVYQLLDGRLSLRLGFFL